MEFFKYNQNNMVDFLNQQIKEILEKKDRKVTKIENIDKAEPVLLTSDEIKKLLEDLKKYKADCKKDFYRLRFLFSENALNVLKKYYTLDELALIHKNNSIIAEEFPQRTSINAKIVVSANGKKLLYTALMDLYAKADVKLDGLKTYSHRKVQKLIEKRKIVPVGFTGECIKEVGENKEAIEFNVPCELFYKQTIDNKEFNEILVQNPVLLEEVMADIDGQEAIKDYEEKFVVTYKKCLNYLVECAKVAAIHEQEIRKNFQKQIQKSNDRTKDIEDAKKIVIDTTKGR